MEDSICYVSWVRLLMKELSIFICFSRWLSNVGPFSFLFLCFVGLLLLKNRHCFSRMQLVGQNCQLSTLWMTALQ